MRARLFLGLLLVAACTKTALDDVPDAQAPEDAGPSQPPSSDATADADANAPDGAPSSCSSLPAYVCDFSIGSCHPLDAIGSSGTGVPSFPADGGPDGSRAFRADVVDGGSALYLTSWRFGFDGGATSCNIVCDVDLRLATEDPASGTWMLYGQPDFSSPPSRLEVLDAGWVHTGDAAPAPHPLPISTDWFHARLTMTRNPGDAGATTTLTLSSADASPDASPSSTTQQVQEMPIGFVVAARAPAGASATTYADNIVCRAFE